jgi:phosphatidylinositol alpha-mannosyltransferase
MMRQMKVGLLIDDHMERPGGVQEYVRGLARYLVQQGHTSVIFTQRMPTVGSQLDSDIPAVPLGVPLPLKGSGSSTSIPLTLATPRQLRQVLEREACDVLHIMAPYSPTLSGRLLVQSQAVHVMTFLVAIEPGPYRTLLGMAAKLQWRSLAQFDARIAISSTAAETARALYSGNYQLIPCGVDTSHFHPDVDPLPQFFDRSCNLLYVGRLEKRKGVQYLIRAFARLEPYYPNLRLLIGGDGPERSRLQRLVAELGLRHVQFLGYVSTEDLPRLFRTADIFCAPATYAESFGIVLIEAMASGLPIVAAANAGYAGLLSAHPGNMLVPPANERGLAGALATLIEHLDYRREVGARNSVASARYAWQNVGQEIVSVYEQLLEHRGVIRKI